MLVVFVEYYYVVGGVQLQFLVYVGEWCGVEGVVELYVVVLVYVYVLLGVQVRCDGGQLMYEWVFQ